MKTIASLNDLTNLIADTQPSMTATTNRKIPPLENWSPKFCGDMDLTIKANGEWWHEGKKMIRQSMIDLFSSVLWVEEQDGQDEAGDIEYFLKTPAEKLRIHVEDVPLLITGVHSLEENGKTYLEFTTPHGDNVIADEQHPIVFRLAKNASIDSPSQPYILVRQNGDSKLYGLIHRNVFYHLINLGDLSEVKTDTGLQTCLTLRSGDCTFKLSVPNA